VKQANAPVMSMHSPASLLPLPPSGADADLSSHEAIRLYSPDPPTRLSLFVVPQLPSSSEVSPTAAAATPANKDQRHGDSSTAAATTLAGRFSDTLKRRLRGSNRFGSCSLLACVSEMEPCSSSIESSNSSKDPAVKQAAVD